MGAAMAEGRQKATLLQVVRMVLSAFFGIRKRAEHEKVAVTPAQIIIVGMLAGAIFVGAIVSVVRLITR